MSVPDWGDSTAGLQRLDTLKRRGIPLPQEVCPTAESPLFWWHRFGWSLVHQPLWPAAALNNPIVYYLERRWLSALLMDILGVLPWLLLIMLEAGVLYYAASVKSVAPVTTMLFAELLVLPLLAGCWAQLMVLLHYTRIRTRLPWEELTLTRLDAQEIMVGISLRPMLTQVACAVLMSVPLILLIAAFYYLYFLRSTVFRTGPCEAFFFFLLVLYRVYILKASVEYASILALRSCLFLRGAVRCLVRAWRDWFWPWALIPILLPAAVVASILIQKQTVVFFYLAIVVPLLALWLMFTIPGMLKSFAEDIVFWAVHHKRDWVVRTGVQSDKVPANILAKWKLERSLRK